MAEGETLSDILVAQGFPESYRLLESVIEEAVALNPHVFLIPDPDLLTTGDIITLPLNPLPPSLKLPIPVIELEYDWSGLTQPVACAVITKGSYFLEHEGSAREASDRHAVFVGDTVVTREQSVIRLQFVDGAVFSMGSSSRFVVDEYDYAEQRPESGFRSSLRVLLGAVAGISGEIGEDSRDSHRVDTPLATIGLRGTEYTLRHCEQDCGDFEGTSLAVTEGAVALTNDAGEVELNQGEFAQAQTAESLSPVMPIPDGFLDLEAEVNQLEVRLPWWQWVIDLFA